MSNTPAAPDWTSDSPRPRWALVHLIAFVLGGCLAAVTSLRPSRAWDPAEVAEESPKSKGDEPAIDLLPLQAWEDAPAGSDDESDHDWSPREVWERIALDDPAEFEPRDEPSGASGEQAAVATILRKTRSAPRRFAMTATLVVLFFAGAALSAGAGDQVASFLDDTTTSTEADPAAAAPADSAAPAEAAASADAAAAALSAPGSKPHSARVSPTSHTLGSAGAKSWQPAHSASASSGAAAPSAWTQVSSGNAHSSASAWTPTRAQVRSVQQQQATERVKRQLASKPAALDPEAHTPGMASVVWLNRALPDPTPPALRLSDQFAHRLVVASRKAGVRWSLVLAVLRAEGAQGHVPASRATLRKLSNRLAALKASGKSDWEAVVAITGDTSLADRAIALEHYDRAVGLWALVHGLEAAKPALGQRLLSDPRVEIYSGGRFDIAMGRVDVRVLGVIAYLADTFGQVTVSCLISGHGLYARPGVISAHIYGRAVDIASVGGFSVYGHQEIGGITEDAVRDILLLPSELQPKQVISLLGLGGPSFPLANHDDHIHVGY
jgi:hypothetical protein